MEYKIVISDRAFNIKQEVQDIASRISWDYNRVGGCGGFSFDVPERHCNEQFLGANYNVKIYIKNLETKNYDLWYQGRLEHKRYNIQRKSETIKITGMGYQSSLSDIYVDRDHTSDELSVIVKSILDNDVTPNTDISYSTGDITATSFTPDNLSINTSARNAFQTLADIAGTREWGVDKDRKFFFKQRSSTVGIHHQFGHDVVAFKPDSSSKDIINRVVVIGDGGFSRVVNDIPSQTKFGRRDRAIQNTSVTTNAVADQMGSAILEEFKEVVRRASIKITTTTRIEDTLPIPLLVLRPKSVKYGQKKYGTFLYSGKINYQINRIKYSISKEGTLFAEIQLGQLRPDISETVSQLEYELDQLRQVGI